MDIYSLSGALTVVIIISALMFSALEVGYRLALRAKQKQPKPIEGTSVVEGAVLTLLGLMLTFTLAQSKENFEARKQLLIDMVNAVTTTYDQAALLPPVERDEVRELLRRYVDEQIAAAKTQQGDREERNDPNRQRAVAVQHEIWRHSVAGCGDNDTCGQVLLPSVNKMSELAFKHLALTQSHKPWALLGFLCLLANCGAVLAGYALAAYNRRRLTHWFLYVASIAVTLYMIIEVEFPGRWGFIRIGANTVAVEEVLIRVAQ
jgi:hypothetical protein